jgi:competence protein ComEC
VIRSIPVVAFPAAVAWLFAWWLTKDVGYRQQREPLFPWVADVHVAFLERAGRWSGDAGALVPGLVLGNTDAIPESLAEAMRVTSLTHLMAVSGANCAIVVGLAFGVAALCGAPLVGRVAAGLVALGTFVVLVGPEPSVIRSSIMAAIGLGVLVWGRPVAGVTALSLAVLLALVIQPTLSHSIGFALSVAATLGLLVIARPLAAKLERWLPTPIALLVSIPMSAAIACQPIILVFSPSIPTYGIVANILAEPFVPLATVTGLLSILAAPIPLLSDGLLAVASLAAGVIAFVARTFASFPVARIPWPPGAEGIVLATVVSLGIVLALVPRFRTLGGVSAVIAGTIGLSMSVGASRIAWSAAPPDWSWAQCDVGQGDAVVVRDAGSIAVFDTGRTETPLRECLAVLGVGDIDLLVLTHFDVDHAGGYASLVGRVDTVLHGPTDGSADEAILREFVRGGAVLHSASRGLTGRLGRLDWRVLWPNAATPREPGNPSSVVLSLTAGTSCDATCITGLNLGDLPGPEQSLVLSLGGVASLDVVKVSHHGSRDQNADLYRRIRAPVSLIGVGADNEYGHPTRETLDILAGLGSTTLRSDLHGIVLVSRSETGELRVWRERQP